MKYYPAFINLKNKKGVVVGGGKVAERKVRLLIKSGASVRLISPGITDNIRKLAERGLLSYTGRNYRKGDLKDAYIVIAATSSEALNSQIARDAPHLVNVVDMPSEGNYIVPSIVKRGPLTIAISTGGASPAVSKAIRKEIESYYSNEFALYLKFAEAVRKMAMKKITNTRKRERFLQSLASDELISSLRREGFRKVRNNVLSHLNSTK
ncbi:MAG: bifunctional precorrin-2 dehydrogenase/sirohydrochlorin ferrochelatase [Nitrospiraceae bacterium]|nr:MAG: bifunctional precorrin-2 dehydrogenase/sirohydrochlorin ferrochelatase [Nitrospiraceae bacterium]